MCLIRTTAFASVGEQKSKTPIDKGERCTTKWRCRDSSPDPPLLPNDSVLVRWRVYPASTAATLLATSARPGRSTQEPSGWTCPVLSE